MRSIKNLLKKKKKEFTQTLAYVKTDIWDTESKMKSSIPHIYELFIPSGFFNLVALPLSWRFY